MLRVFGWALLMLFTGLCDRMAARRGRPAASPGRLARDAFGTVRRRDVAFPDMVAARIRKPSPCRAAFVAVVVIGR